ncbi:hypothetical protein PLESTB_000220600 [Pleodorina starrii]|uniref:Uncharacterized protein n=1 Tax=Pleodorina starrii TaxID=330485 RepID=A0A9W6BC59_9CHLO|nr:hypothetical protein PLESTM_001546300 [Pleodorina starrii]GLC49451.1 hypothetical protein PLESTB_000220600 [Pleodorina starrii]GLC75684.1 hypothetical protein PLESTF_001673600 [Pleodorina starrii]
MQLEALEAQQRGEIYPAGTTKEGEAWELGEAEIALASAEPDHENASMQVLYESDGEEDDLPIAEVLRRALERGKEQAAAPQKAAAALQELAQEMLGAELGEEAD